MAVNIFNPMDVITNSSNSNINVDLEKLNIYVDFKAYRRGSSEIIFDSSGFLSINESSDLRVDMMGKNNDGFYTTNWSNIEDYKEGFGITSIRIKTNSSFIPQVSIEFLDIRGLNFFNKGTNSPYAVLFDFPPAIYELTVKGYYGLPIKYSLHLVNQNTRFDSSTGNYVVNADFIANTFAPLTDILFQYVVNFPLMYEDVNLADNELPNSTYELIKRIDKLYKNINYFIKNTGESKTIDNNNSQLNNIDKLISNINYKSFLKNNVSDSFVKFCIVNDNERKFVNNITEYRINSNDKLYIITTLNNLLFTNSDVEKYLKNNISSVTKFNNEFEYGKIIVVENNDDVTYNYMDISRYVKEINYKNEILKKEILKKQNDLDDKLNEHAKKNIGFLPTIKNVMTVICNDVDKMFEIFKYTDKQAVIHHKNYFKLLENNGYRDIKNGNLYSFPLFVERKSNGNTTKECRVYPKNELFSNSPMPETQLIDDFINVYLNTKRRRDVDSLFDYDETTGNGRWIPISVLDSKLNSDVTNMESPYNLNKIQSDVYSNKFDILLNIISERFSILTNYTYPYQINIYKNFIEFLAKAEALNIINSIIDEEYIIMLNNKLNDDDTLYEKIIKLNINFNHTNIINSNNIEYPLKSNEKSKMMMLLNDVSEQTDNIDIIDEYLNNQQTFLQKLFGVKYNISFSKENVMFNDLSNVNNFMRGAIDDIFGHNTIKIEQDINIDVEKFLYATFFNSINIFRNNLMFSKTHKTSTTIDMFKSGVYKIPQTLLLHMGGLLKYKDNINFMNKLKTYKFETIGRSIGVGSGGVPIYERPLKLTLTDEEINYTINALNNIPKKDKIELIEIYNIYYNDEGIYFNLKNYYNKKYNNDIQVENDGGLHKQLFDEYLLKPVFVGFLSDNFFKSNNDINENYNNLNNNMFEEYLKILKEEIKNNLKNIEDKIQNEKIDFYNSIDDSDIKTQLYYSFKNIVDKWVRGFDSSDNYPFNRKGEKLIDKFIFVDRAMNDIGDECIINANDLIEMSKDSEINVFTAISRILSQNGFEFFPLQNFINHSDNWEDSFKITENVNKSTLTRPSFVCMYVGGVSSSLNTNNNFIDDGLIDLNDAEDFSNYVNPTSTIDKLNDVKYGDVKAFKVVYGLSNQSIFNDIEIDSKETPETNESLAILSSLAGDESNHTPVPKAQNLYSLYEKRSYNSKIKMLGNMMIQPTQYYQIEGVNLFSGAYIILNVEHDIKANHIETRFNGTRILKYPNPIVNNFTKSIRMLSDNSALDDIDYNRNSFNGNIIADNMKYNAMNDDSEITLRV